MSRGSQTLLEPESIPRGNQGLGNIYIHMCEYTPTSTGHHLQVRLGNGHD